MQFKTGQLVTVTPKVNSVWAGNAIVLRGDDSSITIVKMLTGRATGSEGGFRSEELQLTEVEAPVPGVMKILKIKRSQQDTGLKVYGEMQGESGKTYKFAYFRRPNFRGWLCTCESFMLSKFAKHQNCKHLKFVRKEVGRYAASIK